MKRHHLSVPLVGLIVVAACVPLSAATRRPKTQPAGTTSQATTVATNPAPMSEPFAYIVRYEYGQSREPLAAIEEQIRAATDEQSRAIEVKLLAALKSPEATVDCKAFVCRMLQRMGSAQCVPVLAGLLADEKVSHMARLALQGMADPKVDEALRDALGRLSGKLRVGVISTIGARGDRKAVADLAKLITDKDADLADAAVSALGQIGGSDAAKALAAATVPDELQRRKADACLMCADKMVAEGQPGEAAAIYRGMFAAGNPTPIRIAALRGIARTEKEKAGATVLAALKDKDADVQSAAGKFLGEMPGASLAEVAKELGSLPAGAQVVVLGALAEKGERAALPAAMEAMKSKEPSVCIAAIRALGKLGDESAVAPLAERASQKGEEADAAKAALVALQGPKVNEKLIAQMQQAQGDAARTLIAVLSDRQASEAVPALLKTMDNTDKTVKAEAARALGVLAGAKDLPALVKLLTKTDAANRGMLESAIGTAASRLPDADKRVELVLEEMPGASVDVKASLLRVLGRLGGAKALAQVQAALKESDAKLKEAAVRALTDWPDTGAAEDLLKVASGSEDRLLKALAMDGYLRIAAKPETEAKTAAKMFQNAADIAKQPDEKKKVLSGLGSAKSVEALKVVVKYLDDAEVNAEACVAAINLGKALTRSHGKDVTAAMKKIVETSKDSKTVEQAQGYLKTGKF